MLSPEDDKRPVVGFLRMAGWSEEHIAQVVAAHKRGAVFKGSVTLPSPFGAVLDQEQDES